MDRKRSTSKSPALSSPGPAQGEPADRWWLRRPAMFTPVAASSLEDIEVIRLFRAEVSRRDCVEIFREVGVVESEGEKKLVWHQ